MSRADKLDWLGAQGTATITAYGLGIATGNSLKIATEKRNYKVIISLMADYGLAVDNTIAQAHNKMYQKATEKGGLAWLN